MHEMKGSSPTLPPMSVLTNAAIENATLKIADWLSEYTHHFHHSHHSQLPVQPALKVVFPKKPATPILTSSAECFTVITSRKTHGSSASRMNSSGYKAGGKAGITSPVPTGSSSSNWKELNKHLSSAGYGASGGFDGHHSAMSMVTLNPSTNWSLICEIDLSPLVKLLPSSVYTATAAATTTLLGGDSLKGLGETLQEDGNVRSFDKSYNKLSSKTSKSLQIPAQRRSNLFDDPPKIPKIHSLSTTSLDPMSDSDTGHVFATDAILALLMISPRSFYPWDLVARVDSRGRIIFDARNPAVLASSLYSVNETSSDATLHPEERRVRFEEAFLINESFRDQVLKKEAHPIASPGAMDEDMSDNSTDLGAVRYRRFPLGDNLFLVCRSTVDGVVKIQDSEATVSLFALNEYYPLSGNTSGSGSGSSSGGLFSRLDSQKGAVLGHEMKNNGSKLAKWALQALLADTDYIKVGFITRTPGKDKNRYDIVGISQWNPEDFATHTANVTLAGGLAVLKAIVDRLRVLPAGSYVLHKEHINKHIVRIYELPI
ncbi:subunit D of eukaryotic translation initiation factor 3 [Mitosporidium daphniae]|uniref:Subunit D of eukaryotic translation initiation factor 3 n=1 Tax=Mitosporidium daphniae TaxID=1485682 RepID=A0A098VQF3_9MICR|nr:subunit D of eukaryotic translation initiation factor 3 [Mitosporidium daphniae]KGG51258.1 subunit D of eukaryotic translation initiation factor 3 [Mitosporidium daphniae]|eukprot:XP_013237685.1 subunit D of eukaryotic translation initiation factor 3 [Mitosporidium daphniae]